MPISLKAAQGGGGLPKLAPELSRATKDQGISLALQTAEQQALSLTGKWAVSALGLNIAGTWPGGNIGVRMVIDGQTIWNSAVATNAASSSGAAYVLYGIPTPRGTGASPHSPEFAFLVDSGLQLYITLPAGATAISLQYTARPIL
jgi:hypothetical protein